MDKALTDSRRRAILGAARRLLVRRGFQDALLEEVAREAGVAKGTLFLYYRSKDELFSAAFADLADRLGRALEALPRSGLRGRPLLLSAVRTILHHFERNRDFMAHFGSGRFPGCGASSRRRLMGRMAENLSKVVSLLRRSGSSGARFRTDEYKAAALFGLCRSAVMHKMITGRARPLEATARRVVELFLHGVSR